jgi:hypothetical protein
MQLLVAAEPPTDERGVGDGLVGELVVLALPDVDLGGVGLDVRDIGLFREHPNAFVGVDSHADVATVEVIDLDVSPHVTMSHVVESLARRGPSDDDLLTAAAAQLTAEMLNIARQFPVGTIMHMDGPLLHAHVPLARRAGGRRPVCDPERGGQPPS